MKRNQNDQFQLKLVSTAILAGASIAGLNAWSQDFDDNASCEQIETIQKPVAALGAELEILSWNIQKSGNQHWQRDLAALSDSAHLVFIQEAVLEANLSSAIPLELHQEFAPGYRRGSQRTGVMTLSASTPNVACDLSIKEPWLRTPKATSVIEYALQEREHSLLTINLHAVNFTLGVAALKAQLHAVNDYLENHRGPVIIAGDLNTWSLARQQLVDRFMAGHGLNAVDFETDHRSKVFGRALDHIYIRGLEARSAEVVQVTSSDHNPLKVRLRLL